MEVCYVVAGQPFLLILHAVISHDTIIRQHGIGSEEDELLL